VEFGSWYLFEIKGESLPEVRTIHNAVETDDLAKASLISSKSRAIHCSLIGPSSINIARNIFEALSNDFAAG
jgi:hypothetical protein